VIVYAKKSAPRSHRRILVQASPNDLDNTMQVQTARLGSGETVLDIEIFDGDETFTVRFNQHEIERLTKALT
jgi:hypothetical protein